MEFRLVEDTHDTFVLSGIYVITKRYLVNCAILPTVLENVVYEYMADAVIVNYSRLSNLCVITNKALSTYVFEINEQYICDTKISLSFEIFIHNDVHQTDKSKSVHLFEINYISKNIANLSSHIMNGQKMLHFFTKDEDFNISTCMNCYDIEYTNNCLNLLECNGRKQITILDDVVFSGVASMFKCILNYIKN